MGLEIISPEFLTQNFTKIFNLFQQGLTEGYQIKTRGKIVSVVLPYSSTLVKEKEVSNSSWKTGDGSEVTFTDTLTTPVVPGSITVAGATDDGEGAISGTGVSGTIDYETGALSVTFDTAPADESAIPLDYKYADSISTSSLETVKNRVEYRYVLNDGLYAFMQRLHIDPIIFVKTTANDDGDPVVIFIEKETYDNL